MIFLSLLFILITECIAAPQRNVNGSPLQPCSTNPLTGWFRNGYCEVNDEDYGVHALCAEMTAEFLQYTKARGNDLSTPRGSSFPGLKPGDRWCLCVSRWAEAQRAGFAPRVVMDSTNEVTTRQVGRDTLQRYASTSVNGNATCSHEL